MTALKSLNAALKALNDAWDPLYDAAEAADDGTPEKAALDAAEDSVWESCKKLRRLRREMVG